MRETRNRILAVGVERRLFNSIAPLLDRASFVVDRVPRGESGVALASHVVFDLMIVGHPLADLSLPLFLSTVRQAGAASAAAQVVVLAAEDRLAEVVPLLTPDRDVALSVADPRRLLQAVATRLLRVPARMAARLLVRVEVEAESGKLLLMCQSENLSERGMLLRTSKPFPRGTPLNLEFALPGDRLPLKGNAEVVRHAALEIEKVEGMGVRFVQFQADGRRRLLDFLRREGVAH